MNEIIVYIAVMLLASTAGYYVRSLSLSGAIGTFITGCVVGLGFGWEGLFILCVFFASSSFWSKYKKQKKRSLDDMLQKGDRRDWIQVVANGSIASACSLLYFVTKDSMWMYAFIVAVAAANSDTWASEIGVLSKRKPIYILSGKIVEQGTSGAVSFLGTFASLFGSLFIVLSAAIVFSIDSPSILIVLTICGFLGSIVDTLLGATVQARYTCSVCNIVTEKTSHCHKQTILKKGIRWVNNDVVNLSSVLIATSIVLLFRVIFV